VGLEMNINTISIKPRVGRNGKRVTDHSLPKKKSSDLENLSFLWVGAFFILCYHLKGLGEAGER
jgi:hypothetical protein